MYEIRKRSTTFPDLWYVVARVVSRVYAKKIADMLNVFEDGEFDVVRVEALPDRGAGV